MRCRHSIDCLPITSEADCIAFQAALTAAVSELFDVESWVVMIVLSIVCGSYDAIVSIFFDLKGKILASAFYDAALIKDMHMVRNDIV